MQALQLLLTFVKDPATLVELVKEIGVIVSTVKSIVETLHSLIAQPQTASLMTAISHRLTTPKAGA